MTLSGKPSLLAKPTLDTKYHIDYDWWERTPGEDLRVYLASHLQADQRERLLQSTETRMVDYIHPQTGEVTPLDELWLELRMAAEAPDFITPDLSVVDSIFRVFLRNDNTPLSCRELGEQTGREPVTILKLLSGNRVYKGIRPYVLP